MSAGSTPVQNTGTGILYLLSALFVIAVMDTLVKSLSTTFSVPMIVWARYTFHFIVLLPLLIKVGPRTLAATTRPGLQIGRSLILFVTTALFFGALSLLPLADATSIIFTSPLMVTALSVPLLRDHVGARRWISVFVGFAGVLIIIRPGMGVIGTAAILPLAAAFTYALYQITTRIISRTDGPLTTLFYTALTGAVCMNVAFPLYWQTPSNIELVELAIVGCLGGLGQFLFIKAYSHATPMALAPFIYTQIVSVTILGYFVFGDFPDAWTIVGAVIIVSSGIYIWHREHRRV